MVPPPKSGPRYNEFIQSPKVRVIDDQGENLGVMYTREAMEQAAELGLDLVEVSPNADPPVAKFLDVGRFKYEAQKKANQARKSQRTQEIKEIKMRPNIDDHDYDTKMKKVVDFLEEGDKVEDHASASAAARCRTSSSAWICCAGCRSRWSSRRRWRPIPGWRAARC